MTVRYFLPRFLAVFLLLMGTAFAQSFTGAIDGYYGYNFNRPFTRTNRLRNFDFDHNQFGLNYAEVAVEKKPAPIGFRADVGFGDAIKWIHLGEPAGADVYQHLQQAYVSLSKNRFQVDAGKFVTSMGAEVIETKDNWNYSRSLLFSWAIPYYHFGARTTFNINDKVSLGAQLVNGWNNVKDNNVAKTVLATATIKPTSKLTWTGNYIFGKEQSDADRYRHAWDTTTTFQLNENASFMANYDYGMDRVFGKRVRWQGIAAYGRFSYKRIRVSPRWEWYADPQNFTIIQVQGEPNLTVRELTATNDFVFNDSFFLRAEYRLDYSGRAIFERKDRTEGLKKNQNTILLGFIYSFNRP